MAKQLSAIQQRELVYLKDRSLTVLNFMIEKNGSNSLFKEFQQVIIETFENRNFKGLRHLFKDINEWAKGLSNLDFDELNSLLNRKFGEDFLKESEKISNKISQILENGKISNEDEYRLLLSRVEDIYSDHKKKEEFENINKLLIAFQN